MTKLSIQPVNQVVDKALKMYEVFLQDQKQILEKDNTQKPVTPKI